MLSNDRIQTLLTSNMTGGARQRRIVRIVTSLSIASLLLAIFYRYDTTHVHKLGFSTKVDDELRHNLEEIEQHIENNIVMPVPLSNFGDLGHRILDLQKWVRLAEERRAANAPPLFMDQLWSSIERLASDLLPFVGNTSFERPFHRVLHAHEPGSKGIVMTFGRRDFRFACHFIANVRQVIGSSLPIQIAYGGDDDLPSPYRDFIISTFAGVEMLNILDHFNHSSLELDTGKWAIKTFAMLASRFEKVMLVDADIVFLRDPNEIFRSAGYEKFGAYLFRDVALHPWGRFHGEWWQDQFRQIGNMSDNILNSRAYLEPFSEHGESGVVAMNKGRLPVLMALLHTCYQNTYAPRKDYTYVQGNGDKESWWLGLEALGAPYTMESNYAAALGNDCRKATTGTKICTGWVAHLDHLGRLLWWNGSLQTAKKSPEQIYTVPTKWMVEGRWTLNDYPEQHTMDGAEIHDVSPIETRTIGESMDKARALDALIGPLFTGALAAVGNN